MKCPFRLVCVLPGLIFLWTSPFHAITLHVSDDQSVWIDRPTSSPSRHRHTPWKSRQKNSHLGSAKNASISIQKLRGAHEDQGFVKFDISPLPPDSQIERAISGTKTPFVGIRSRPPLPPLIAWRLRKTTKTNLSLSTSQPSSRDG